MKWESFVQYFLLCKISILGWFHLFVVFFALPICQMSLVRKLSTKWLWSVWLEKIQSNNGFGRLVVLYSPSNRFCHEFCLIMKTNDRKFLVIIMISVKLLYSIDNRDLLYLMYNVPKSHKNTTIFFSLVSLQ